MLTTLREEGRVGMEEEPTGAAPGLAVLYGFLFLCDSTAHSYRDWSRGARRGWPAEGSDTEQEGPKENRASGSLYPPTRVAIPPHLPLLSPASSQRGRGQGCWIPSLL